MEETRIVGHDARDSSNATQTVAEKIIRDAETRERRSPSGGGEPVHETTSSYLGMTRKEAPPTGDKPPTSSETIVRDGETLSPASDQSPPGRETTSSYLGMTRKEAAPAAGEAPVSHRERRESDAPAGDDAAPFSSALGIPTLIHEDSSEPSSAPKGDNPAPFSSALHIPTLINESKRSSER